MNFTSPVKRTFFFLPCFVVFYFGYFWYLIKGKSIHISYKCLRFLHVITNCKFNFFFNNGIALFRPIKPLQKEFVLQSVIGKFDSAKINQIVSAIQKDGYYIFDEKLNENILSQITDFALDTPVRKLTENGYSKEEYKIRDLKVADSPRYQFHNETLFACKPLSDLVFDELFITIAEQYLKCRPIFDYLVMWWSFPFGGNLESEAAQMYHYDMDRIKFLKFFFYINDVDENNGPHCFVKGSHINKPKNLLKDGRITDNEIKSNFNSEDILEIKGKKGTIIAVDTIGFHKGKPLINGERLLFQLLYSNSLFGQKSTPIKLTHATKETYKNVIERNKEVYAENMIFE